MGEKFDDVDRYITKEWLENHLKTNLKQFGRKRKYFLGDNGKRYCILGGQVFHGIPKEIIDSESRECINTKLVIVKKYKDKFEIYMNSIEKFIENKKMLSYSEKGEQYEFNIRIEKGFLKIKEFQNIHYYLERVGTFPYTDEIRRKAENNFEKIREINSVLNWFPEEKEKLINDYKSKGIIQPIF